MIVAFIVIGSYLAGAVPFGYLIGRARGVDLFAAGSGNIGATNVGRVLGRSVGALAFVLDFAKGALPVAAAKALDTFDPPGILPVAAAVAAFLGHLFPVYLRFRGGKGVATGAGTVAVLVPVPAAIAVAAWAVVVLASRYVSLASLVAVVVLVGARLASPDPFAPSNAAATAYCLVGAAVVAVKHRANVGRLVAGTENRIGDTMMRRTLAKGLHVLALGIWVGAAGFFNFAAAPAIFASFDDVVKTAPSDRTAHVNIVPPGTDAERTKALGTALAGAAVGPVFPRYFAVQIACGAVAFVTALGWWRERGRVHRWRAILVGVALAGALAGWAISGEVSRLRLSRFDPDQVAAAAARAGFAAWHVASLGLSAVTVLVAAAALACAARLPDEDSHRILRSGNQADSPQMNADENPI